MPLPVSDSVTPLDQTLINTMAEDTLKRSRKEEGAAAAAADSAQKFETVVDDADDEDMVGPVLPPQAKKRKVAHTVAFSCSCSKGYHADHVYLSPDTGA